MKYRYFLFDWDGCLVDTLPIWLQGMKEGLSGFGINATNADIKKGFQTWDIFARMGVTDMDLFTQIVYTHVDQHLKDMCFNDGVDNLLKQLKNNNCEMAIVTSAERSKVSPVLERLDAVDYFKCIISRNDVNTLKPSPEPIEKALVEMNGEKQKAVMVGDSIVDVEAGKIAGVHTVWFSSQPNQEFHLNINASDVNPDMIISHMAELEQLI